MRPYITGNRPHNGQLAFWLGSMAIGAAAMYLADPAQGKRRRAAAQGKVLNASNRTGRTLGFALRETGRKLSAWQSQAGNLLDRGIAPAGNRLLEARVHSKIKKLCRYPESVNVHADGGCVTLTGSVPAGERARLITRLYKVPGVIEIKDKLNGVTLPSHAFGAGDARLNAKTSVAKTSAHAAALLGGTALSTARRLPVGSLLAVAGLGYLIRSLGDGTLGKYFTGKAASGASTTGSLAVNLQKSIEIQASPETVFDIWSKYENFPQFMSHVVEVRDLGMQRSRWTLQGPGGVRLEWDALLTKCLPPSMLAWKSEPGSEVEHAGSVRFESSSGGTLVTVRMNYAPAGRPGQGTAALLKNDPARQLEDDLQQMKHFIESRNLPRETVQPLSSSSAGQVLH